MSKPIFEGEFIAFSPFDRAALRILLDALPQRPIDVLEVGSWLGNGSTITFIEAIHARKMGGRIHCVDTWQGNQGVARHQAIVRDFDVFSTFMRNVTNAGGADIVHPVVMASPGAAESFKDESLDLVFIDADHSYSATRADIQAWWPKVARGGILCGHDCEVRPTPQNAALLWRSRDQDTLLAAEVGVDHVVHIHPGCVLAVNEALEGKAQLFAETDLRADERTGRSTIWWVRRED